MPVYVALLRAVNVGGTGKLPMTELKTMCVAEGFADVQTYIASGNVVFTSKLSAARVKAALEKRLAGLCRQAGRGDHPQRGGDGGGSEIQSISEGAAEFHGRDLPR